MQGKVDVVNGNDDDDDDDATVTEANGKTQNFCRCVIIRQALDIFI